MKKLFRAVLVLLSLVAAVPASATEIVYLATGNAGGTLNGVGFSGTVAITSVGDLSTRQPCLNNGVVVPGCEFVFNDELLIASDSFGILRVVAPSISFFNNPIDLFGFSLLGISQQLPVYTFAFMNFGNITPAFGAWDGFSDFGPMNTNWGINGGPPSVFVPTDGGILRFTTARPVEAIFGARVVTGAVPEPSTWLMLIIGFGLAGGALRRRKGHAVPAAV